MNFQSNKRALGQGGWANAHLVEEQHFASQVTLEKWFAQLGLASKKGQEVKCLKARQEQSIITPRCHVALGS